MRVYHITCEDMQTSTQTSTVVSDTPASAARADFAAAVADVLKTLSVEPDLSGKEVIPSPEKIAEKIGGGVSSNVHKADSPEGSPKLVAKTLNDMDAYICQETFLAKGGKRLVRPKHITQEGVITMTMGKPLLDYFDLKRFDQTARANYIENIAQEMALAVAELHSHGVVHNDIKPNNMITIDGRLQLIDWGISSFMNEALGHCMVQTPPFRAPEIYESSNHPFCNYHGDVWAMGASLYTLIFGDYVFYYNSDRTPKHLNKVMRRINNCDWITPLTKLFLNDCLSHFKNRRTALEIVERQGRMLTLPVVHEITHNDKEICDAIVSDRKMEVFGSREKNEAFSYVYQLVEAACLPTKEEDRHEDKWGFPGLEELAFAACEIVYVLYYNNFLNRMCLSDRATDMCYVCQRVELVRSSYIGWEDVEDVFIKELAEHTTNIGDGITHQERFTRFGYLMEFLAQPESLIHIKKYITISQQIQTKLKSIYIGNKIQEVRQAVMWFRDIYNKDPEWKVSDRTRGRICECEHTWGHICDRDSKEVCENSNYECICINTINE